MGVDSVKATTLVVTPPKDYKEIYEETIGCFSDPIDIFEENWQITNNKRKAGIQLESSSERTRGAFEPSEVSVESERKSKNRKASTDIESPSKRQRSGNDDSDLSPSSRDLSPSNQENRSMLLIGHTSRAEFEAKYLQFEHLGQGGFGSVYAGTRESDNLPVAIKYIPKKHVRTLTLVSNKGRYLIPHEVLLMVRVASVPGSGDKSAAVSFIEWYNLDQEIILIMERPVPAVDLSAYIQCNGHQLDEGTAKIIIKQLVEAAIEMHSKGVFHRDIKLENVLIQNTSDGPRVRIIDFGCSSLVTNMPCSSFSGTFAFAPPEYFKHQMYKARPTTVWQLGALLFNMVDGCKPFTTGDFTSKNIQISSKLSHECRRLLHVCLAVSPKNRATLHNLQQHSWGCIFLKMLSTWSTKTASFVGCIDRQGKTEI
ncbi:serine/threonine-protein kinase pim-1 [Hippoglossus stenolepis]|uniref:serine/threonine-protein kinase pim-1 n=1 Tax=Hippoglossus stenolepis TaxID=195615 RepID=UPI001FAFE7F1|nr:serine/threonine-protein kinase pim-1 [Hippoglossus stenolepis]